MKTQKLIIIVSFFIAFNLNAQTKKTEITEEGKSIIIKTTEADTSKQKTEEIIIIEEETETMNDKQDHDDKSVVINIGRSHDDYRGLRLGMLDLGFSSYVDDSGSLDLPQELAFLDQVLWRSINVGLHVINLKTDFGSENKRSKFGISTGLKVNWVHYSLAQDYSLTRNAPTYTDAINFDVPELRKNRLRGTYLQIPFLLEFNSKPSKSRKSFNLGIGYVHQFLLGSQFKLKTTEGDKEKTRGDFNLRKSMGMIEGRLGIGHLNFYLQYGLNTLFQDGAGPELTPVNFGVNIIPR